MFPRYRPLSHLLAALTFCAAIAIGQARADCATSSAGFETCGAGECAVSSAGFVSCSKHVGGGAAVSSAGFVSCGVGACAVDNAGFVKCSPVAGGQARVDGAFVHCTDARGNNVRCESGSRSQCE